MISRLFALMKKEFLAIKNDKKSLVVVIIPPLIQIFIFAFAATLEVKHINLAVFDKDGSVQSQQLIQHLKTSEYINSLRRVEHLDQIEELIDTEKVLATLVIPQGFAKNLTAADAEVGIIFDGRHSNTAQIAEGYLTAIITNFTAQTFNRELPISLQSHFLYNQNLNNFWWIVPNLFGSITMIVAMILTSLSIARERELGTFEQILVTPLHPFEILLGKLLPALLISTFESTLILFAAVFLFDVPVIGSLPLLYTGVVIFLFSMSGVGLFISALSNTQQQAILGSFVFILPSFLLSGFATPIENMPSWLQPVAEFLPLKYYLLLIKGVFLKDISWSDSVELLLPMIGLGIVFMGIAMMFFRKHSR
ncbi:ABC transporter permease [Sulfurimonas sp. C5]|uniref:ABC transporter permease n=1 Tax=Sulfurimonas sp. C5 TaxID=3036947 RepID=UPI002456BE4A|nr:ABC transporter permease [Sulfurimonas sp. C5]MDH4945025.1 ABC transporter permease [Sulfurimonas sp. C5]